MSASPNYKKIKADLEKSDLSQSVSIQKSSAKGAGRVKRKA